MVTFVAGFIDPAVAAVQVPAMAEINRRAAGKSIEEREKIEEEVLGKTQVPKISIAKVADHIEHIRDVAGIEHVGLGGDFDGNSMWPEGLSDVSMYPNLFAELIRRGWSDGDLKLLAGENLLRAMERAEAVSQTALQVGRASARHLRCPVAGNSGSIAAARSRTSSAASRTARSSR